MFRPISLPLVVMEHLNLSLNVPGLLMAGVIALLGFAGTVAYRTFDIRQQMIRLREKGLV